MSTRNFIMTCPFNGGNVCDTHCALLLKSNYGKGMQLDDSGYLPNGFYVCGLAKLAEKLSDDDGLFISNYE